ncbi:transposase, partial [Paraburkholderia sp. BR14320]|uniref:transposase n=1 Tax=unclassified Paraburkholderia TaxID=2615204 RepID=UPI0034CDC65A
SRTIRTARSRTSGEYLGHFFFVFSIAPFSQEVEPPEIPGRFRALKELVVAVERTKAQIRARVEHPFHVVKNLFRHRKVRYKGLLKNTAQLFSLFALANLAMARNRLRPCHGSSPSGV